MKTSNKHANKNIESASCSASVSCVQTKHCLQTYPAWEVLGCMIVQPFVTCSSKSICSMKFADIPYVNLAHSHILYNKSFLFHFLYLNPYSTSFTRQKCPKMYFFLLNKNHAPYRLGHNFNHEQLTTWHNP